MPSLLPAPLSTQRLPKRPQPSKWNAGVLAHHANLPHRQDEKKENEETWTLSRVKWPALVFVCSWGWLCDTIQKFCKKHKYLGVHSSLERLMAKYFENAKQGGFIMCRSCHGSTGSTYPNVILDIQPKLYKWYSTGRSLAKLLTNWVYHQIFTL